jgi:K+-transporting ATPase c subunit
MQKPDFVARWAGDNSTVAEQWVKDNSGVVADFLKKKEDDVKSNSGDAAKDFWKGYARAFPSTWPTVEDKTVDRKTVKVLVPAREGPDVQAFFFDLWLQDNPKVILERVPADMVMSSGSGLDPHITLKNALYQLKNRVAEKQAQKILEDDPALAHLIADAKQQPNPGTRKPIEAEIKKRKARLRKAIEAKIGQPLEKRITEVIEHLLHEKKEAPLGGLAGVDLVNVLELNLALNARMKQLQTELH